MSNQTSSGLDWSQPVSNHVEEEFTIKWDDEEGEAEEEDAADEQIMMKKCEDNDDNTKQDMKGESHRVVCVKLNTVS